MKVEITFELDGNRMEAHSIKKSKITLGRSPDCDITLSTDGISRKHAEIEELSDGSFKITDLGSSNGTFINDDKLEANTPHDFNTFFPAKLGFGVSVALVDDDGISSLGDSDNSKDDDAASFLAQQGIKSARTSTIKVETRSSRPPSRARGSGSALKKAEKNKKKDTASSRGKRKKSTIIKILILGLGIFAYYQFVIVKKHDDDKLAAAKAKQEREAAEKKRREALLASRKRGRLTSKQMKRFKFPVNPNEIYNHEKCVDVFEKIVCQYMPKSGFLNGAYMFDDTLFISIDAVAMYKRLKGMMKLTEADRKILIRLGSKAQGIKFSKVLFLRNNYKIAVNKPADFGKYVVASIVALPGLRDIIRNTEKIQKVVILAYRLNKGNPKPITVGKGVIKRQDFLKMLKANTSAIDAAYKYAFHSGYKKDFNKLIWGFFNIP